MILLEKELSQQASISPPSKEESKSKIFSDFSISNSHPCFAFLKNIDEIRFSELHAKTGFKYRMQHPYSPLAFEIEASLKMCTVYKTTPYGPAFIVYKDDNDLLLSFTGIGIFTEG